MVLAELIDETLTQNIVLVVPHPSPSIQYQKSVSLSESVNRTSAQSLFIFPAEMRLCVSSTTLT
jgi:hypothetical protein